jgi:DNA processing protein
MSEAFQPSDAIRELVRLSLVSGVGPRIRQALVEQFGDAGGVFDAGPSQLQGVPGVGPKLAGRIVLAREEIDVDAELELCREHDVSIVTDQDEAYPRALREIHDPPGVLYVRGGFVSRDALAIGIVGTRHATNYGKTQAHRLAGSLSRAGLTVISGLARGVDAAAHRGALEAGGRTLAVLGSGVLNIYPAEHKELAGEVAASGAVVSESPPRFQPLAGSFPQRNRLISGMSLGVIVIEAAERSGALITARHAMEQGREVFAVPGRIDSRASRGCHQLLRDGARLVESADDVLEELGPLVEPLSADNGEVVRHPAELQLNEIEQRVLQAIDQEPTSIDEVVRTTEIAVPRVLSTISVLEMKRLVRRAGGNRVMRA